MLFKSSLPLCQAGVPTPTEVQAVIVRMYEAGKPRREIMAAVGCGKSTISAVLKKHNVQNRTDQHAERVDTVRTMFQAGSSFSEIAKHLDITKNTVSGIIFRNKITRSEALNLAAQKRCGNGNPDRKARAAERRAARLAQAVKAAKTVKTVVQPSAYKVGVTGHIYAMPPTVDLPTFTGATPNSRPKHFMDRLRGECTWPVSGEGADTFSCCARIVPGTSWCEDHNRTGRNGWRGKGYAASPEAYVAELVRKFAA